MTDSDKWIPVGERLPADNEEIWVYDAEEGVIIGYHSGFGYVSHNNRSGYESQNHGWCHVYGDGDGLSDDRLYRVTHWQPLPRPEPPGTQGG